LRRLRSEILKNRVTHVKGVVPLNVADYLLNRKRKEILDVETSRKLTITIEGDRALQPGESRIICD
jgi:ribonuclease E